MTQTAIRKPHSKINPVMSSAFAVEWARHAHPGDRMTYFCGVCLVTERTADPRLDHLANTIFELDAKGMVCALQAKDGPFRTRYFIEKVSPCFSKIHQ